MKWNVYNGGGTWLGIVEADSQSEAEAKARIRHPDQSGLEVELRSDHETEGRNRG